VVSRENGTLLLSDPVRINKLELLKLYYCYITGRRRGIRSKRGYYKSIRIRRREYRIYYD